MKKSIAIMLVLAIIRTLSFTGCGEDSENSAEVTNSAKPTASAQSTSTPVNSEGPKATEAATSAPTAAATKAPETESAQTSQVKPTESAGQTETAATNAPTTKPTSDNKTVAPTKAPATLPPEDPSVDYSEWGKHGFENLLPIALPFSDEEANWHSRKVSSTYYEILNRKKIFLDNPYDFVLIFKDYVKSYETLGYTVILEDYAIHLKI